MITGSGIIGISFGMLLYFIIMGKHRKKIEPMMSKADVRKRLSTMMANHPAESFNYKQLAMRLQVKSMDTKRQISEVLKDMAGDGELEEISTGRYKIKQSGSYITGEVELTARGTAYIISNESEEDVFVTFSNLKHALNGDKVKVLVYARSRNRRPEGEVIEILVRKKATFVGVLQKSANYAFLIPTGKQFPYDIFISTEHLHGAENGDKVVVKIKDWPENQKNPVGEVVEVLGRPGDNDTEMNAIMAEYELPVKFPANVLKAAERISLEIPQGEMRTRRDCRNITTFTIDPKDAKDFDDALSVRQLENGLYEVGVHIADVSYYVKENTVLDKEAYARATSVYLVDRTIPMLPERLSNGVCSLRPGEDKLCFSAIFKMDAQARVLEQWFGRTLICSDRRFTYEEAQEIIEGAEGDYKPEILLLNDLAQKLRKERFKAGAIDFDRVEVKFNLDEKGHPTGVYFKRSKEANKLIEEFMLLANKKVAERIGRPKPGKKAPAFVYRVHEQPLPEKLEDFNRFVARFGYGVKTGSRKALTTSMNNLMREVKDKPEQNMIETLAVRTMAKAAYSTDNIGHYGLAFDFYTHFTSPIRRYPDVMVHRLLQRYLDDGRSANKEKLEEYCKHSSDMEQVSANAERSSVKYKQVEFMADRLGLEFEGTISGVTQWGFYVELEDSKCEGLVSMTELDDDFYEFDEKNYCITGRYHHKTYQLGDRVTVRVAKANLVARQLDFELVKEEGETVVRPQRKPDGKARAGSAKKPVSKSGVRQKGKRKEKPVGKKL